MLILLAVVAYFGSMIDKKIYSPNVMTSKQSPQFILIPTGSVFEDVVKILDREHLLINEKSFRWTAGQMDRHVRPSACHML